MQLLSRRQCFFFSEVKLLFSHILNLPSLLFLSKIKFVGLVGVSVRCLVHLTQLTAQEETTSPWLTPDLLCISLVVHLHKMAVRGRVSEFLLEIQSKGVGNIDQTENNRASAGQVSARNICACYHPLPRYSRGANIFQVPLK